MKNIHERQVADRLSLDIGVPSGCITDILNGRRRARPACARSRAAAAARRGMLAVLQRQHAMEAQTRWAAEDHDVAMRQAPARGLVGADQAAEQEDGRQAERHGDDGRLETGFVAVLVQ